MPQPKSSPAEVSMPTFATLEEWTRSQVQELMQSVLEEEVTHVLGRARYERQAVRRQASFPASDNHFSRSTPLVFVPLR